MVIYVALMTGNDITLRWFDMDSYVEMKDKTIHVFNQYIIILYTYIYVSLLSSQLRIVMGLYIFLN